MEIVKSVCYMCHRLCGIDAYVENGRITKVAPMSEHPRHQLCPRAYAIPELVHSPERLTDPLIKVNGQFKKTSWDEVLDFMAGRLSALKQEYGARAVLVHCGIAFVRSYVQSIQKRFWHLYGTPNYTTGASICYLARTIAYNLTCGAFLNPDGDGLTRCLLVWGNNPDEVQVPLQGHQIADKVRKGARLIVVDPRTTELARQADIHAQIRPGTDCALALGMLNVIISENLYDKEFVNNWTVGFEELSEYVKEFSPERVEDITWVPAQTIREMAKIYAISKPAAISTYVALDHSSNGVQAFRAMATLVAITGNLDIPGGNIYASKRFSQMMSSLSLPGEASLEDSVGTAFPMFTKFVGESQFMPAIDQMISAKPYPIKGLVISGGNPVLTWPNTAKFKRGRDNLDFMAVVDIFLTDTAKMADVVLPGTTFIERPEIKDFQGQGPCHVTLSNQAIKPIGNCMDEWRIWAELGKRMGYGKFFPWADTEELLAYLLKSSPFSLEQLRQNSQGFTYAEKRYRKYLIEGFNTPSKKVEIFSQILNEHGYDPLPVFHEPVESYISSPGVAKSFPLIFISGIRTRFYSHSQYRNLPGLRKQVPEPLLEIHPRTANALGIDNEDMVQVESKRGKIMVKAKLTEDIHPKVVAMQHGWSQANANELTDDMALDPISGYPACRSGLCKVTKAQE